VLTLFSRHLEGDIAPEVCAQMEEHLRACGGCRRRCDSLRRTLASCRALQGADVPPQLAASVKAAVRAFVAQHAQ
jgi:RNA polymerase sigma-70 factor (ECF subfamily)